MTSNISYLLLAAFLVVNCQAHTLHTGRTCPTVTPFPNLSIDKILGTWYVVYNFDTSNTCLQWTFNRSLTNPEELEVTESRQLYLLDSIGVDHKHAITATLDMPNLEVPANLRVRWPTSITGKADFVIFDTDYDNYMAVFQCDRAGLFHRRDVTILSKTRAINDMFIDRVRRLLDSKLVDHDSLSVIDHNACKKEASNNWHIKGEFFGLLPESQSSAKIRDLNSEVRKFDTSQLELIGEGISEAGSTKSDIKHGQPNL